MAWAHASNEEYYVCVYEIDGSMYRNGSMVDDLAMIEGQDRSLQCGSVCKL